MNLDLSSIKNNHLIRSYQLDGIKFLENNKGIGMLNFDMGLGKTLTALSYTTKNNLKTLIVCPKSLIYVWIDEIERWTDKKYSIITTKNSDYSNDFSLINYDIVKKKINELKKQKFDCIVLDESQRIKTPKSQRSKALKQLISTPKRVLLTGTPITNKPLDIFNQLNYIDPATWNNWLRFRDKYIQGYYHPRFSYFVETGTKNIDELSRRIMPYVIRRKKEDVENLPPKIYNKFPVRFNKEYEKKYNLAMDDFRKFLKEYSDLTEGDIRRRMRGEVFSKVQALKQLCSSYKVESETISSLVGNILDNNPKDKIVIFSQYKDIVTRLQKQIGNSVLMYGDVRLEERHKAITEFQENPKINVFIGTIQCAGVGITLTKASNVVFCDLPWTPADISQGIDRCHRIGTTRPVNVFYIINKDTIDEKIYYLVHEKQLVIDQIIDKEKSQKTVNVYNEFLDNELKDL